MRAKYSIVIYSKCHNPDFKNIVSGIAFLSIIFLSASSITNQKVLLKMNKFIFNERINSCNNAHF